MLVIRKRVFLCKGKKHHYLTPAAVMQYLRDPGTEAVAGSDKAAP